LPLVNSLLSPSIRNQDTAIMEGLDLWEEFGTRIPPPLEQRGIQASWDDPFIVSSLATLDVQATTQQEKAKLLAVEQPDAGTWLNALPSPQLGTLLDNESFRVSCTLRLGGQL